MSRFGRSARLAVALLASVALATVLAVVAVDGMPGRSSGNNDEAAAIEAADEFLDTYMDPNGRVVRRDQGGDTVSEGQAYAMLLAVAIEDRVRFDAAWSWTQTNLQRDNGTLATQWANGSIVDDNPASDAELDAIRALDIAADRFDDASYRRDARRLTDALLNHLVLRRSQPVLLPGPWATEPVVTLNPSYFAPRSFDVVAEVDASLAEGLADSSLAITTDLLAAHTLPPDWATLEGGRPVPAPAPSAPDSTPRYSYDAVRLPVRYAESCSSDDRDVAAALLPALAAAPAASIRQLDGSDVGGEEHASALVGVAGAATALGDLDRAAELLDEAAALDRRQPTYYGSAWVALGRVMLQTDLLGGCP